MPKTYLSGGHTAEDIDRAIDTADAIRDGITVEDGWDLNEVSAVGTYKIPSTASVQNTPASGAAIMIMTAGNMQVFIPENFAGVFYMRIRGAEWYEFSGTALS